MSGTGYARPSAGPGMLRVHLNENTAGCSPHALAAVRALSAQDLGRYPDYDAAVDAVSRTLGVPPEFVLLTNGLDEGILAATAAAFRRRDGHVPEALGVRPSFDMYETAAEALGGRMRTVALAPGFAWTAASLLASAGPATRIVFVTNPHNPSGCLADRGEILEVARRASGALVFVDEAYAEFCGETLIAPDRLSALPNLVVGRTFSKAYGLAGLRVGALVAAPETLQPIRRIVPPYSVNTAAAAALPAALADTASRTEYLEQVRQSRRLLAAACERLGFRTFASAANFVLVEFGPAAAAVVRTLESRGIAVRDRSREPGCEGCVRVTTGRLEDTARVVAALEEICRDLPR